MTVTIFVVLVAALCLAVFGLLWPRKVNVDLLASGGDAPTLILPRPQDIRTQKIALIGALLASVALYLWVGRPGLLRDSSTPANLLQDATRLSARLEKNPPGKAADWLNVARLYQQAEHPAEAVAAFEKAGQSNFSQQDFEQYLGALVDAGMSAHAAGDYAGAIATWQKVLPFLPPESPDAAVVKTAIARANQSLHPNMPPILQGTVRLNGSLQKRMQPGALIFLFVKDDTSPVPLAALKITPAELPFNFSLNDGQSIDPTRPLSGAGTMTVQARLAQTGNPVPFSGDFESAPLTVKAGSKNINLTISRVLP